MTNKLVETKKETNGTNSVEICVYEQDNAYFYEVKARLGNRAFQIIQNTQEEQPYENTQLAKKKALIVLGNWCNANRLRKQFNEFTGLLYRQLELF